MENNNSPHINIIAFNVPYPPNYGGIIDVFYKIKALHRIGVNIILHCYEYEHGEAPELEEYCEKVYYYKRKTGFIPNISLLPYNVNSRKDSQLLRNLLSNSYPILFEGLHTCYFAKHPSLVNRVKICRMTNIEQDYYLHLAKAESNPLKKLFFIVEALRFKHYEPILTSMDYILAVSQSDQEYLNYHFPEEKVLFIPCFHQNDAITSLPGESDYILYHGKLSVPENTQAALYLIENVFGLMSQQCIIAGMNPPDILKKKASQYPNIRIEANPSEERMNDLIENAQIHVLITFQPTGLKLKLLNSLFGGRHVVVNSTMIVGSGLGSLCKIADNPQEMIKVCDELMDIPFTSSIIEERMKCLFPTFSNNAQALRLKELLFH